METKKSFGYSFSSFRLLNWLPSLAAVQTNYFDKITKERSTIVLLYGIETFCFGLIKVSVWRAN